MWSRHFFIPLNSLSQNRQHRRVSRDVFFLCLSERNASEFSSTISFYSPLFAPWASSEIWISFLSSSSTFPTFASDVSYCSLWLCLMLPNMLSSEASGCFLKYSFSLFLCFLLLLCSFNYSLLLKVLLHGWHLYKTSLIALALAETISERLSSNTSSVIGAS